MDNVLLMVSLTNLMLAMLGTLPFSQRVRGRDELNHDSAQCSCRSPDVWLPCHARLYMRRKLQMPST